MRMNKSIVGQHRTLSNRLKKSLAACALSGIFALSGLAPVIAGGETRTISLHHIHTGESLTVTYMKDGRYVPSAMKQINYILRDWRANSTTTIDPRTIDLVWELHADLKSHEAINIVCGYRSPKTNAMLHRIGRHVAKESQHMAGKAIDFYFPDITTLKIRNTALVRQRGGVGYYRSAGGPTGFLHVDSGHVRHWGPFISASQMASIFRDGQKTVGRRLRDHAPTMDDTQVADGRSSGGGFFSRLFGIGKKQPVVVQAPTQVAVADIPKPKVNDTAVIAGVQGSQDDLADLSADASTPPAKPVVKLPSGTKVNDEQMASLGDLTQDAAIPPKPKMAPAKPLPVVVADTSDDMADVEADVPDAQVTQGKVVPKPRLKPVEIMLMAAANMKVIRINAASAPPPSQTGIDTPSPVADSLGTIMAAVADDADAIQKPNKVVKVNLSAQLRNGTAKGLPVIKPMIASVAGSEINWWPQLFLQGDAAVRRDGAPSVIGANGDDSLPVAANLDQPITIGLETQESAEGKGDLLVVNREGKGDLELATAGQ
jgi:uncharacterized protein YcbK (DUF882 family)